MIYSLKKLLPLLIIVQVFCLPVIGQTSVGNYQSGFRQQGNEVFFSNADADVKLEFNTPGMFRVRASWDRKFQPNEPYMVVQYDWPKVAVKASEKANQFLLQTEKPDIKVNKAPFGIAVYTKGKQYVHVLTPLDTLPVFAKGGAIIPMQPEMKYFDEKPVDLVTLDIFPHGSSSFELYEDDGKSLNYKNGEYAITQITSDLSASGLKLAIQKPNGAYKVLPHHYLAKIHWNEAKAPASIIENGKKVAAVANATALEKGAGWYYDAQNKLLWVKTKRSNKEDIRLEVKL